MDDRRLFGWSAGVVGLLVGALLGALLLLWRERGWREDVHAQQQAALATMLAELAADSAAAPIVEAPPSRQDGIEAGRGNAIVAATRRAAPAVVTVTVNHQVALRDPRAGFFEYFFPDRQSPRLRYQERQNYGSGVIVGAEGYVVTNAHVIGQAPLAVTVTLTDGKDYPAEIVEVVDHFDLAFLKLDGENFSAATLADSDELQIGEWAIAIGSPFGQLLADTQPTVTVGVISALNRDIVRQRGGGRYYLGMIQTDAAINPGNSGGALVNAAGEVVGINTFIFSESGGSIGIGFAVPSNRVRWVLEEVREFGHYRQVNWGVALYPLTGEIMAALGVTDPVGYVVRDIVEDSPAWRGGLRLYDVVRTINDVPLASRDIVIRMFYEAMVGDRIRYTAEREGQTFTGEIVLEEVQR